MGRGEALHVRRARGHAVSSRPALPFAAEGRPAPPLFPAPHHPRPGAPTCPPAHLRVDSRFSSLRSRSPGGRELVFLATALLVPLQRGWWGSLGRSQACVLGDRYLGLWEPKPLQCPLRGLLGPGMRTELDTQPRRPAGGREWPPPPPPGAEPVGAGRQEAEEPGEAALEGEPPGGHRPLLSRPGRDAAAVARCPFSSQSGPREGGPSSQRGR